MTGRVEPGEDLGEAFRRAVVGRRRAMCRFRGEHVWVNKPRYYLCMNCKNFGIDGRIFANQSSIRTDVCGVCWMLRAVIVTPFKTYTNYHELSRVPSVYSRVEMGPVCTSCSFKNRIEINTLYRRVREHNGCRVELREYDEYRVVWCQEHGWLSEPFLPGSRWK